MWLVQTRELRSKNGDPSGAFHLTAESDEGGGFHAGCDHEHASAAEAEACDVAKRRIGEITGFPVDED